MPQASESAFSWLERKFPFSFNEGFHNREKLSPDAFSTGFTSAEDTIEAFCQRVFAGDAVAAQFSGPRRLATYLRAGFVAVDVDAGLTLEGAKQHPLCQCCVTAIYTTARHTAEANRFRLIFLVEVPITDPEIRRLMQRQLARLFGGDMNATDAARIPFGNDAAQVWFQDAGISTNLADEMTKAERDFERNALSARSASNAQMLAPDLMVRTKGGVFARVEDLPVRTTIHCPFHDDAHPSAFIVESARRSSKGIHCSVCNPRSFWGEAKNAFDFYDFETAVLARHAKDHPSS